MSVIQQEAYNRIIQLSDDKIQVLIAVMDMMQVPQKDAPMDEESLEAFMKTAGQIEIDGAAISRLRECVPGDK